MNKEQIRALMSVPKDRLLELLEQSEGDEIDMAAVQAAADLAAAEAGKGDEPEAPMADAPEEEEEQPAPMADAPSEEEDEKPMSEGTPADAAPLADGGEGEQAMAALAPIAEAMGSDIAGAAAALMENMDAVLAAVSGALDEPAADAPLADEPAPGAAATPLSRKDSDAVVLGLQTALGAVTKERDDYAARLEAIEQRSAEEAVDAYVQAGCLTDDEIPRMVALYRNDPETWRFVASRMSTKVPVGPHASGLTPPANEPPAIDEDDEAVKGLRRYLSRAGVKGAAQDRAVAKALSNRNQADASARRETRV